MRVLNQQRLADSETILVGTYKQHKMQTVVIFNYQEIMVTILSTNNKKEHGVIPCSHQRWLIEKLNSKSLRVPSQMLPEVYYILAPKIPERHQKIGWQI